MLIMLHGAANTLDKKGGIFGKWQGKITILPQKLQKSHYWFEKNEIMCISFLMMIETNKIRQISLVS